MTIKAETKYFLISAFAAVLSANILLIHVGMSTQHGSEMLAYSAGAFIAWLIYTLIKQINQVYVVLVSSGSVWLLVTIMVLIPFLFDLKPNASIFLLFLSSLIFISATARLSSVPAIFSVEQRPFVARTIAVAAIFSLPVASVVYGFLADYVFLLLSFIQALSVLSFILLLRKLDEPHALKQTVTKETGKSEAVVHVSIMDRLVLVMETALVMAPVGVAITLFEVQRYQSDYSIYYVTAYFIALTVGVVFSKKAGQIEDRGFSLLCVLPATMMLIAVYILHPGVSFMVFYIISGGLVGVCIPLLQMKIYREKNAASRALFSSDYSITRFAMPGVSGYFLHIGVNGNVNFLMLFVSVMVVLLIAYHVYSARQSARCA